MTGRCMAIARCRRIALASSIACGIVVAAHAQDTGTVAGCITDTTGQPIPGASVDVGGGGTHHIVVTDALGCYTVPNVPAGSYFVFARLQGFLSATLDNLMVKAHESHRADFRMRIAPMCDCLAFPATLAELWNEADAVVRLRIIWHDPDDREPTRFSGALSTVWKRNLSFTATQTLTFTRQTAPSEVEPYAIAQEFVMFLKFSLADQTFVRMSSGDGTVAAFAVENGRIHSAPFADFVGVEAELLTNRLAALAARREVGLRLEPMAAWPRSR